MGLDNKSLFYRLRIQHEWNRSESVTDISFFNSIEVIVGSPQSRVGLLVIDAILSLGQRIWANRSARTVERSYRYRSTS